MGPESSGVPSMDTLAKIAADLDRTKPERDLPFQHPSPDPSPDSPSHKPETPSLDLSLPSVPTIFANLVKLNFMSKFIMLPTSFDPSMLVKFKPDDEMFEIANLGQLATCLFKSPSPFKIHFTTAFVTGKKLEAFIEDVSKGIVLSWNISALSIKFAGVLINGPIGMCMPGCMIAAAPMIPIAMAGMGMPFGVGDPAKEFMQLISGFKNAQSICTAIAQGFNTWVMGYSNQAIPFPGGAAAVGSMIPSPNVPLPLASGTSTGESGVMANALSSSMMGAHGSPGLHTQALFDSFAKAFETMFTLWKSTNFIMNILGAGGVAPPTGGPVAGALGNGGMILGMPAM